MPTTTRCSRSCCVRKLARRRPAEGARRRARRQSRHRQVPEHRRAEWNVTAWERVALTLAERPGSMYPAPTLFSVAGRDVLIVERFDRRGPERVGYASAMTMLEAADGDQQLPRDRRGDRAQLAGDDSRPAPAVAPVAFSVFISNTDDHLRNHGFLRSSAVGWELAPAFDVNPNPDPGPKILSTAIDLRRPHGHDRERDRGCGVFSASPRPRRGRRSARSPTPPPRGAPSPGRSASPPARSRRWSRRSSTTSVRPQPAFDLGGRSRLRLSAQYSSCRFTHHWLPRPSPSCRPSGTVSR